MQANYIHGTQSGFIDNKIINDFCWVSFHLSVINAGVTDKGTYGRAVRSSYTPTLPTCMSNSPSTVSNKGSVASAAILVQNMQKTLCLRQAIHNIV